MEINKDNIAEAIKSDEFKNELFPLLTEIDSMKLVVSKKADLIYQTKIDEEVRSIHSAYDDDMFEILGERPETVEGTKKKTYLKIKELYSDLKTLREQKSTLNKESEIIKLNAQIDKLKTEGGAQHVQDIFDQAKSVWTAKELELNNQIKESTTNNLDFKKRSIIQSAIQGIKFNPDTPESIKKLVISQAESQLIKNSKFEGDQFIVLKDDGKPSLNAEYEPKSAFEALMSIDGIKDISIKADDSSGGGGADPIIKGSIKITSVDGKDTKKLIIAEGSFKTKLEFQKVADKALIDSGISKSSNDYVTLKDQAYKDLNVAQLPTN
jgi:hypothetical protein